LRQKGIHRLFLHPQINWVNKVTSLQVIADKLNISTDSLGFIDDEPFELAQVQQLLPGVHTYHASEYRLLPDRQELKTDPVTSESSRRRRMYIQEAKRVQAEKTSGKSRREFLKWCNCRITLRRSHEDDLPRILELMRRTSQMNATGVIYTAGQIKTFLKNQEYRVFVAELRDRFVDYGKIGVAVCRCEMMKWHLRSFQISCRVTTRGIAGVFLSWLQLQASRSGAAQFEALYKARERNQRMNMLYRLSGFRQIGTKEDGCVVFGKKCVPWFNLPGWLTLYEEPSS